MNTGRGDKEPSKRPMEQSSSSGVPPKRGANGQGDSSNTGGSSSSNSAAQELSALQHQLLNYQKYFDQATYPFINDVTVYEKLSKIGQGTFGEVFKGKCKRTGKIVALKKILMENEKEGFPITALREVKMLENLKHRNITDLIEVCSSKGNAKSMKNHTIFYLVFAFCEHDLAGLLSNQWFKMKLVHIKTMIKHMLTGLHKLHRTKILHRDMKAANILISREGVLKLADFGLARPYSTIENSSAPPPMYTNRVVTLWYRPPELLLGERAYGAKIDIWGAGCIMAEMWTRVPILKGQTEQEQLQFISNLCGSINPSVWPNCTSLPLWSAMSEALPQRKPRILRDKLKNLIRFDPPPNDGRMHSNSKPPIDEDAMNLLEALLTIDPAQRISSDNAEDHDWFFKEPQPKDNVGDLLDTVPNSQFEYTACKGAHEGRGARQNQQPRQQQSNAIPAGQYRDTIF